MKRSRIPLVAASVASKRRNQEANASFQVWSLTVPCDFRLARFRVRYSHHLLVRIENGADVGWGGAPLYARPPHQLPALLRNAAPTLEKVLAEAPQEARRLAAIHLGRYPDFLSAVDGALWDLEARREGRSVAALLGARETSVPITEQLFFMPPNRAASEVAKIVARGVRDLKVKISGNANEDLRWIAAVREAAGPDVAIRVDANRGYSLAAALSVAPRLAELGVHGWEEPLDGPVEELAELRRTMPLAIILDESVLTLADLEVALEAEAVDVLNVKLGRVGGITAASAYRDRCASAGVAVAIGCAEDLGPAMAAIVHVSAAWRPVETEGIGWERLRVDLGRPSPVIANGRVEITDRPGWGITVTGDVVDVGEGRTDAALVPQDAWTPLFLARSWVRQQRQRLGNLVVRLEREIR